MDIAKDTKKLLPTEDLLIAAAEQLGEHKEWLRIQLAAFGAPGAVLEQVDDIALAMVKQEEALRDEAGRKTVSITYSYPDEVFEFLSKTPDLKVALAGGRSVQG